MLRYAFVFHVKVLWNKFNIGRIRFLWSFQSHFFSFEVWNNNFCTNIQKKHTGNILGNEENSWIGVFHKYPFVEYSHANGWKCIQTVKEGRLIGYRRHFSEIKTCEIFSWKKNGDSSTDLRWICSQDNLWILEIETINWESIPSNNHNFTLFFEKFSRETWSNFWK